MSATGTERAPWLCRTCVWGFPESVGYSCSRFEGRICSRVVVACEVYRRQCKPVPRFYASKEDGDEGY